MSPQTGDTGLHLPPGGGRSVHGGRRQPGASGRHQELWGSQGTREIGRRQTGGALGTPVKSLDFIAEECHVQNCLETCPLAATAQGRHWRRGARAAAAAMVSHQADGDGRVGDRVVPEAFQTELTGRVADLGAMGIGRTLEGARKGEDRGGHVWSSVGREDDLVSCTEWGSLPCASPRAARLSLEREASVWPALT